MDELVKMISAKTGISQEQARTAVEMVLKFLKERLPDPIAGQLDALISGGGSSDMLKNLGGLFGQK
ncbi:MAG: hypothetical protein HY835_13665 [Anaerolineae bacterium]|nr:hypothetical protein [Anaerolineae bacterium]